MNSSQTTLRSDLAAVAGPSLRKRFHADVRDEEWDDWHWQLRHAYRMRAQLEPVLALSAEEAAFFEMQDGGAVDASVPLSITPYYLNLMDLSDPDDPLRRTMIPRRDEAVISEGERIDPLGEDSHSPVDRIVHTYPHKVLFLVTDFCATYCRYCTRARAVGNGDWPTRDREWEPGLRYIESHPAIRDVLISGGDPLTLSDGRLDALLARLHAIPHVELIRIGTKLPAVLPQRITPALVEVLSRYHPLWLSIHFTHVNELTDEARRACALLADAGVPMMSQTVLLKGVNDRVEDIRALNEALLTLRVKPYYLHMCDPIYGSAHFKVPLETGQAIIRGLHGYSTGYAVPMLMIDAPGGGGKVPVGPGYIEDRDQKGVALRNYRGEVYFYHDPG